MTIDEAITHAEAAGKEMIKRCDCKDRYCGLEHLQLAEWLKELKDLRQRFAEVKAEI